ncbi:diaminopimelate epimerase [Alkalithermobacter thermoalcaliphilus JW-YL-7 = DSM 7308]|uniref:Diaminopimelate epimerase n=1 Tax=Alkalithermobacter thermoalcaliphilus JW-YL-7 = DSM 7308 TaxID=1121328 RepID=A0A150FPP5_CLOPD|nr:Diaminopimelate epimerase [[Clostridium] paradoxum JW-YL-7 = DSM 7308]SHK96779.1 diaminopimelate epimerase [[Clostridium] paradoxum JW-YL-7 = DSM 7308]
MKFWKLHGAGNDFIAIDGRKDLTDDYSDVAKKVCHRHFGVGADGLLVVKESNNSDCKMLYYNSDGSKAKMCGNGIRCFAKFVYENNIVKKSNFTVETLASIQEITLNMLNEKIDSIKVNMGLPNFDPKYIPVDTTKDKFINETIIINKEKLNVSSILLGVPHTVVFVEEIDKNYILKYGPLIENHKIFPEKTNVNFVKVIDKENIQVSTWERGCGYTLACGTGITASVVISNYLNKVDKKVNVISEGGKLLIEISEDRVYMQGPAVKICEGILEGI